MKLIDFFILLWKNVYFNHQRVLMLKKCKTFCHIIYVEAKLYLTHNFTRLNYVKKLEDFFLINFDKQNFIKVRNFSLYLTKKLLPSLCPIRSFSYNLPLISKTMVDLKGHWRSQRFIFIFEISFFLDIFFILNLKLSNFCMHGNNIKTQIFHYIFRMIAS